MPEGRSLPRWKIHYAETYLYDGVDLVGEYDGAGALLRRTVHGPGIDEPLVIYTGTGTATKTWLYADHQGSITATANSSGAPVATLSYGPYGEPNTLSGPAFRYTGQRLDPDSGLYYYKARWYSPYLGRFLQTDPIGQEDDLNLYAYVGNDPTNFTDPTGKFGLAGAIIGGGLEAYSQYKSGELGWNGKSVGKILLQTAVGAAGGGLLGTATKGLSIGQKAFVGANMGAKFGVVSELGKAVIDGKKPTLGQIGTAATVGAVTGGLGATVPAPAGRAVAQRMRIPSAAPLIETGIDATISVAGETAQQYINHKIQQDPRETQKSNTKK